MSIASKLDKHLDGCSVLLWEINLLKQSLHVSMHAGWADFPHDVAEIMKNPSYRKRVVKTDDLEGLNSALANIRKGKSSKVVFRIVSCDNLTHWCLLVGNAQDGDSDAIFGSLICIEEKFISQAEYGHLQQKDVSRSPVAGQAPGLSSQLLDSLLVKLGERADLHDQLGAICDWDTNGVFEAVLFSDIRQREGRVEVHKAGPIFNALPQGKSYPYEGTIAEMIVSLDLSYLIVDDTMESLKPIDWALFVPNGIRSYFAVPHFQDGIIRGVLIFCSANAADFSDDQEPYFRSISEIFFQLSADKYPHQPATGKHQPPAISLD